jgi:uncharacterized protein YcbX
MISITALNIYPIKSCRGIAVSRARLTEAGFEHDREWMVVQPGGRFLTQREAPRLALIEPALDGEWLRLGAPGMDPLRVPLAAAGDPVEVTCWQDRCAAFDVGEEAASWMTTHLGTPARLVRFDAGRPRRCDPEWTRDIEATTRFADAFPWLLLSQASLDDLNSRLAAPLPMNRFRPSIVVDGLPPYGEDHVGDLVADGVRLRAVKPCARCIITTTDQSTAERDGNEPLDTLRKYRFDPYLKGVLFGQNLILIEGEGRELAVGQALTTAGS